MKKAVLFCVLTLLFCVAAYGQEAEKIVGYEEISCEEYLAVMDSAIIKAQNNPTAKIYILIYEGKEQKFNNRTKKYELVIPAKGSAEAKIESIKKYHSIREVSGNNFVFVKAGFREKSSFEIWLVPAGAEPPTPESTVKEMQYRKGRARGFCIDCCQV